MGRQTTEWASRATLACAAIAAAAFNQFLLLFPLALMFALPALWFGNVFLIGASVVGFLILAWVIQPGAPKPFETLARDAAPDFYRVVDDIAHRLNAPRPHAIALDDELNAAAVELNRGLSLRPTRRVLVIGRPLLALLDTDALSAVIAHEFGHFSRQHGRLGHWLYRTRLAWLAHLESANDPELSAWERAGAAFAQRFVPWFSRASFAHARRNEYEADALAAQAFGAPALARALQQIHALAAQWDTVLEGLRVELQQRLDAPPVDWLHRVAQRARDAARSSFDVDDGDDGDPLATHPSLRARLQALDVASAPIEWPPSDACAGARWLGPKWSAEAVESRWRSAAARHAWRCWHELLRHRATGAVEPGSAEAAQYRDALAKLQAGDAAGARRLCSALLEASPSWAVPVRETLRQHASAFGLTAEERSDNQQLLQRAEERRMAAVERMADARRRGEFGAAPLSPDARSALAGAIACHPVVEAAWCVGLTAQLDARRRYRGIALVLRANPSSLAAEAIHEDELVASISPMLMSLCDADVIPMIHVRYTTESVPEELAGRPEAQLFECPRHAVTRSPNAAAQIETLRKASR